MEEYLKHFTFIEPHKTHSQKETKIKCSRYIIKYTRQSIWKGHSKNPMFASQAALHSLDLWTAKMRLPLLLTLTRHVDFKASN